MDMFLGSVVDDVCSFGPLAFHIARAARHLGRPTRQQVDCTCVLCRSLRKVSKPSVRRSAW